MRILHSSDWHLGRRLHGFQLLEDQSYVLDQFVSMAKDTNPDVILLSGDLYDIANPPADAVRLMNDVLNRLVLDLKRKVIVISGNHDSSDRIGFASRLLEESGLLMVGDLSRIHSPLRLTDSSGVVAFHTLPFVESDSIESFFNDTDSQEPMMFGAALGSLLHHIRLNFQPNERNVLLAHLSVIGGYTSESERDIGTVGILDPSMFYDFDYVALGHLHRPQKISDRIWYSGSLLSYSQSEAGQQKSALLVELGDAKSIEVQKLPFEPRRKTHLLQGSYFDLSAKRPDSVASDDYVFFSFTESSPEPNAEIVLRKLYLNFMSLKWGAVNSVYTSDLPIVTDIEKTDIEIFRDFYKYVTDEPLTEADEKLLVSVINEIESEDDL